MVLQPFHKRILYAVTALLWLTGVVWLYLKYGHSVPDAFGPRTHPMQPLLLELHGALAMLFLIMLGTLLMEHVPLGWQQHRQRPSGIFLISFSWVLILTGWGLYYLSDNAGRDTARWIHIGVGVLLPAMIAFHVWRSHQTRRKIRQRKKV